MACFFSVSKAGHSCTHRFIFLVNRFNLFSKLLTKTVNDAVEHI